MPRGVWETKSTRLRFMRTPNFQRCFIEVPQAWLSCFATTHEAQLNPQQNGQILPRTQLTPTWHTQCSRRLHDSTHTFPCCSCCQCYGQQCFSTGKLPFRTDRCQDGGHERLGSQQAGV